MHICTYNRQIFPAFGDPWSTAPPQVEVLEPPLRVTIFFMAVKHASYCATHVYCATYTAIVDVLRGLAPCTRRRQQWRPLQLMVSELSRCRQLVGPDTGLLAATDRPTDRVANSLCVSRVRPSVRLCSSPAHYEICSRKWLISAR